MRQMPVVVAFSAAFLAIVTYVMLPEFTTVGTVLRLVLALLGGLVGALVASFAYSRRSPN